MFNKETRVQRLNERRELIGYHDPWQVAVLEDFNDMIELLQQMNYLLSVSTGNVRVAVKLTLTFILSQTAHFFVPGEPIVLNDLQSLAVTVGGVDSGGNPTMVDPALVPEWTVDNPNILVVKPSAGGQSAVILPGKKLGPAMLLVSVPGQALPQPVQVPITLVSSKATQMDISFTKPK